MGADVHRPCRPACDFASHALNGIVAPVIARASAEENYIRAEASSAGRSSETCPMNILTVRSSKWMRSEEHTSELQSLMSNSYAVFCLKTKNNQSTILKKNYNHNHTTTTTTY